MSLGWVLAFALVVGLVLGILVGVAASVATFHARRRRRTVPIWPTPTVAPPSHVTRVPRGAA